MERGMGSREATGDGAVDQYRYGRAIRFLLANEQFRTRSCARCAGLLVNEWCNHFHNAELLRCVQCGHRIDPVIVQNQIRLPVVNHDVRHSAIPEWRTKPHDPQSANVLYENFV